MHFEQFLEAALMEEYPFVLQEDATNTSSEKEQDDVVCLNLSLFMRVLEMVREDVADDNMLHHVVEKITELAKKTDGPLTMTHFSQIENVLEDSDENDENDESDSDDEDQEDEDVDNLDGDDEDQEDEDLDESKRNCKK